MKLPGKNTSGDAACNTHMQLPKAVLASFFCLFAVSCAKMETGQEPLPPDPPADIQMLGEDIYYLAPSEASVFMEELKEFSERVFIQDGLFFVAPVQSQAGSGSSVWLPKFKEAVESNNALIKAGKACIHELLHSWEFDYSAKEQAAKFRPADLPPDAADCAPPGHWNYKGMGNGMHVFEMSHQAYTWFLIGGASMAAWLSAMGIPAWLGAALSTTVLFAGGHYTMFGKGGGITIYIIQVGGAFIAWYIYPDPPPHQNLS